MSQHPKQVGPNSPARAGHAPAGAAVPAHPSQGSHARSGPLGVLALIERAHAASTPRFVSSVLVLGGLCVGLVALATCTQP